RTTKVRSYSNFPLPKRYSISPAVASPDIEASRRRITPHAFDEPILVRDRDGATMAAPLQLGQSNGGLSMEELWRRSATDIAALVQSKRISAKEVASAALARLDAVNPSINAVVEHRPEDALAQAGAIDAALRRNETVGPLAGVPVTIKVNIDQQGFATTNGLKLQRDLIARSNSPVVDNLRKAGAVILGRTNCPAFSYRWFTTNLIHGDTRNPRDPGLTPGGSSGGAGAAVAAGIGPIAHGTDIAGSIRYPAYACGVHGLRP